jgi:hypothetical protein
VRPPVRERVVVAAVRAAERHQLPHVARVVPAPRRLHRRHVHPRGHHALAPPDDVHLGHTEPRLDHRDRVADLLRLHPVVALLVREADREHLVATRVQVLHQPRRRAHRRPAPETAGLVRVRPRPVRVVVGAVHEQHRRRLRAGLPLRRRVEQEPRRRGPCHVPEERLPLPVLVAPAVRRVLLGGEARRGVAVAVHLRPPVRDRCVGGLQRQVGGVGRRDRRRHQ